LSRKTILALLVLVAGLGFAVWREIRGEAVEKRSEEVPLLEGVDRSRVRRLHLDHLEREKSFAFDRDADGRWRVTEPVPMPANRERLDRLLGLLLQRRGTPVPSAVPSELKLDPPRAIVEIEEDVAGTRKRSRVDFGALDLDGLHFVVRAGGKILRTWRDIDTAIEFGLDEIIDHSVVGDPPRDVVEIHRRGAFIGLDDAGKGKPAVDLALDALASEGTWRATAPFSARLDPQGAAVFVQGCLSLQGVTFPDVGRRLLSEFGLDPPELTFALGTASGRTLTLRLGRPKHLPGKVWHCMLEGQPIVWTIDDPSLNVLTAPASAFLDAKVTRIPPPEIDGLSLVLGGRELRLWRKRIGGPAEGRWLAAERPGPEIAFGPSLPADLQHVEDLVRKVADLEVANFLPGNTLSAAEVRGSIAVQAKDLQEGGEFGSDVGDAERGKGVRFQRTGDTVAAILDPAVLDLLKTPLVDVLSLVVVDVPEIELVGLTIDGAGAHRTFVRNAKGLWTPPDVSVEAKELHPVLDSLTILRATENLRAEGLAPLEDPVDVELVSATKVKTKFRIGLGPASAQDGRRVEVERDGRRAVAKDQGLHDRLLAVLKSG
jgi:hypothetical protein